MNMKRMQTGGIAILIGAMGTFGLAACASESEPGTESSGAEVSEETAVDVTEDLETAKAAVDEALEDDDWAQVMLASDVEIPTVRYGLLVMPFVPTDAVERVTGTVNIDGGNYVIEAESAETGETWQIDQAGEISQVTD